MWSSKGYKRAADKHHKTCSHIIETLCSAKRDTKPQLIGSLYYLGGYILECILKYHILEALHKPKNHTFTKEELEKIGIYHHNLQALWLKATDSGIDNKSLHLDELSKRWNVDLRYDADITRYKHESAVLDNMNNCILPIYNKIKNNY